MFKKSLSGIIGFTAFVLLSWLPVQAAEVVDFSIHQPYNSVRALGMGNAFTAVVDDHSALFYNPAALARREDGQVRLFLRGGFDTNLTDLVDDIEKSSNLGSDQDEIDAINALLEKNYGKGFYTRLPTLGGIWVRPNWGMAFIPVDLTVNLGVHRQITPALDVNIYQDTTLAYGYARDFNWFGKKNRFSMGVTAKAIYRMHASQAFSSVEMAGDSNVTDLGRANEGMTLDADIGTLLTVGKRKSGLFKYVQPTFAFVIRNALDYGFPMNQHFVSEDSEEPPKLQRRFDLGSKWALPKFWVFEPHASVDIRDMGHSNWSLKKGSHLGMEAYWKMYNWWKGHWALGLNQGYLTAGLGARLAWFNIDLVTWGEEVGTDDFPVESRRFMVELSLDF